MRLVGPAWHSEALPNKGNPRDTGAQPRCSQHIDAALCSARPKSAQRWVDCCLRAGRAPGLQKMPQSPGLPGDGRASPQRCCAPFLAGAGQHL
jgi:hypothetical protein